MWSLPRSILLYVLVVEVAAVGVVAAATWTSGDITRRDLIWLVVLVCAGLIYQEATRPFDRVRDVTADGAPYTHLLSVWVFASVLLLPTPLTAVLIVIGYVHAYLRIYRNRGVLLYRKVFSAATVMIACVAANLVLAVILPEETHPYALALDGPAGLVAVVAAALAYRFVNYTLVIAAILATNLDRPVRSALGNASDQLMMAGAVGLGAGAAVVMATRPWVTPLLVLTVLGLHMGLLVPQFRDASRYDSKTSLFNASFWTKLVGDEIEHARRLDGTMVVLVIDLDHFKRVNDRHGHLAGDLVLRAVAEATKQSVRSHDIVGRYGGEEFAVVLPGLTANGVLPAAERIRAAIAGVRVTVTDLGGGERVVSGLTASVGAAVFPENGADRTTLLVAADAALYEAKNAGRDRTRLAGRTIQVPSARLPAAPLTGD